MFHRYYDRKKTSRDTINDIQNKESAAKRNAAEKRVNALWGLLEVRTPEGVEEADVEEIEQYPLGDKRALSRYWEFAGIDPIEKTFTVFETELWSKGGLERVPWTDESQDPVLHPGNA